jgi:NitT/TauT family transport system permease protein
MSVISPEKEPVNEAKKENSPTVSTASPSTPVHSTPEGVKKQRLLEKQRNRRQKISDFFLRFGFIVFLVLLWQGAYIHFVQNTGIWSGALFPSPVQVFSWLWRGTGLDFLFEGYQPPPGIPMPKTLGEAIAIADYPPAVLNTFWRLVKGYLFAIAVGVPIGLFVARFKAADKTIGWFSLGLQALPSICWIPLALIWFGRYSEEAPILFVTIMGAVFATIVSVADGIRNVPPIYSRAGRTLGARGPRLYLSVLLPAALPAIVTGLKIGWSFAYRSLMAAELIVNAGGLGFLLQRDRDYGDADGVIATILLVLAIGIGVQGMLFTPLEKKLQKLWGLSGH